MVSSYIHFTAKLLLGRLSCYIYIWAWHTPAKHLENTQWCAFSLTPSSFLFLAKTLPSSLRRQISVDNSIDDQWTVLALITVLTIDKLHTCISTALSIIHVQQGLCTLIVLCIQYSWTEFLYMWLHSFLMNLYNKTKHTTISHGCYAGVQFIPATSLVRPTIFGPWVTAIDRFHCTMVTPWCQK